MAAARKKPGKKGMTPFVPTEEQRSMVRQNTGLGMTREELVLLVLNPRTGKRIDSKVFDRVFAAELESGHADVKGRVGRALLSVAENGGASGISAGIWIEKTRFGYTDKAADDETSARNNLADALRLIQTSVPASPEESDKADQEYRALEKTTAVARRKAAGK